jgi:hypothetical protein
VCARGVLDAADCLGTSLSDSFRDALQRMVKAGGNDPVAVYLADGARQVDMLLSDFRALGSWRARGRLLREHVLPSRDYLAARYGPRARLLAPVFYVYRLCVGAPRWFRPAAPRQ